MRTDISFFRTLLIRATVSFGNTFGILHLECKFAGFITKLTCHIDYSKVTDLTLEIIYDTFFTYTLKCIFRKFPRKLDKTYLQRCKAGDDASIENSTKAYLDN